MYENLLNEVNNQMSLHCPCDIILQPSLLIVILHLQNDVSATRVLVVKIQQQSECGDGTVELAPRTQVLNLSLEPSSFENSAFNLKIGKV